jgi:hypothetical protein
MLYLNFKFAATKSKLAQREKATEEWNNCQQNSFIETCHTIIYRRIALLKNQQSPVDNTGQGHSVLVCGRKVA